jgi:hypothetical protein
MHPGDRGHLHPKVKPRCAAVIRRKNKWEVCQSASQRWAAVGGLALSLPMTTYRIARPINCALLHARQRPVFARSGRLESTLTGHSGLPRAASGAPAHWRSPKPARSAMSLSPFVAGIDGKDRMADAAVHLLRGAGKPLDRPALLDVGVKDLLPVKSEADDRKASGAFTNSTPRGRRASSCRQKPSRSLRLCSRGAPFQRGRFRYRKRSRNPRRI